MSEDRQILSVLFSYLFQLNDVYSCEAHDGASDLISEGIFTSNQSYLRLRREIRSSAIYAEVAHLIESSKEQSVIRMLQQMVPYHEAEVLCIILFSLPPQMKRLLEQYSNTASL